MALGQGQPNIAGSLVVEMADVTATEIEGAVPALAPGAIINQPNTVTLSTSFTIKDAFARLVDGEVFNVVHRLERVEDGLRFTLAGGSVIATVVGGQIVMPYTSVEFTTGATGSAAQLEIAPGATEGTFRVLTQLVAQNANVKSVISAFHDGLLLTVI
jgi:hypothetical protein